MNFGFEYPAFFWLLLIIVPVCFIAKRFLRPLFLLNIPLGAPTGASFSPPNNLKLLMRLLYFLEIAGALLLFTAAAAPRFSYRERVWLERGADIIFVLDISPSMAALDMGGRTRFDAARELLVNFADSRLNDAIGLVAFAEDSALIIPLTTDRSSLYSRLETLAIGEMGDATAIGTALAFAAFHLNRTEAPRRAIVLITDGENNAGSIHPETAGELIGQMGITLWALGVGSSGRVPFSYVDPASGMFRSGIYESSYDPLDLEKIALAAGGNAIHAPNAQAFAEAFARIDKGETTISLQREFIVSKPLHAIFIAAALICLWIVYFAKLKLGAII